MEMEAHSTHKPASESLDRQGHIHLNSRNLRRKRLNYAFQPLTWIRLLRPSLMLLAPPWMGQALLPWTLQQIALCRCRQAHGREKLIRVWGRVGLG